jgi:hypothetical protein
MLPSPFQVLVDGREVVDRVTLARLTQVHPSTVDRLLRLFGASPACVIGITRFYFPVDAIHLITSYQPARPGRKPTALK